MSNYEPVRFSIFSPSLFPLTRQNNVVIHFVCYCPFGPSGLYRFNYIFVPETPQLLCDTMIPYSFKCSLTGRCVFSIYIFVPHSLSTWQIHKCVYGSLCLKVTICTHLSTDMQQVIFVQPCKNTFEYILCVCTLPTQICSFVYSANLHRDDITEPRTPTSHCDCAGTNLYCASADFSIK